jgi:hypothetical protein
MTRMNATSTAPQASELNGDQLERVVGGSPTGANSGAGGSSGGTSERPVKYMEFKLKEVLISGVVS